MWWGDQCPSLCPLLLWVVTVQPRDAAAKRGSLSCRYQSLSCFMWINTDALAGTFLWGLPCCWSVHVNPITSNWVGINHKLRSKRQVSRWDLNERLLLIIFCFFHQSVLECFAKINELDLTTSWPARKIAMHPLQRRNCSLEKRQWFSEGCRYTPIGTLVKWSQF